jgi:hypothetical protein
MNVKGINFIRSGVQIQFEEKMHDLKGFGLSEVSKDLH